MKESLNGDNFVGCVGVGVDFLGVDCFVSHGYFGCCDYLGESCHDYGDCGCGDHDPHLCEDIEMQSGK